MSQALKTIIITVAVTILLGSLFAQKLSVLEEVTIDPNPMDKKCVISITLNQTANLGVNVEDELGNIIKTLYWGPAQKSLQLDWNRISDSGEYVPSGVYYVVVNYSGRYTSIKKTLILK